MSDLVIIGGLSGAGRSTAADTLEDLGWFVIDNLPAEAIPKVAELVNRPGAGAVDQMAFVVGRGAYEDELARSIAHLRREGHRVRVLFLDASDDVLVRRFEGTRRRHPVEGEALADAIAKERELLLGLRDLADVVVDTSELNVHELHDRIAGLFSNEGEQDGVALKPRILSFGYKHGLPLDADLVLDCRFLPNPHWVEELRPQTGLDAPVREYVLEQPAAKDFLARLESLLELLLPSYVREGKSYLTIAVGCTGGHHRSVSLAEELARVVEDLGFDPSVEHRDVER